MRLQEFIRTNLPVLVEDWAAQAACQLPAAKDLEAGPLRDSAEQLLIAIADDLDTGQSTEEQIEKSKGRRPGNAPRLVALARDHAEIRLGQGFTLDQMVSEYRALRESVLNHWGARGKASLTHVEDILRFNQAVDEGLTESSCWYGARVTEARDLFLGVLSHDLRNPLGAILMSAHALLRESTMGHEATRGLVRILNSGKRMQAMIEDLLDFIGTRLGGTLPIERAPCLLGALTKRVVDETAAAHPGVHIDQDCDGDLSGQWDAARLMQLLSNLLGNAIQHGRQGTPVTVLVRGGVRDVRLIVHNEGPPIKPAALARIFDPMMRGVVQEAERREQRGSLGLGLYICRQIAQAHGGRIDVTSSAEAGTTFTVVLPRKPGA